MATSTLSEIVIFLDNSESIVFNNFPFKSRFTSTTATVFTVSFWAIYFAV